MKYIGRTRLTLEDCLLTHTRHARHDPRRKGALQVAIRALGHETFRIQPLEEHDADPSDPQAMAELDHRELELMVQHDSIRRGWNRYASSAPRKGVRPPHGTVREHWDRILILRGRIEGLIDRGTRARRVALRHLLRQLGVECAGLVRTMLAADAARRGTRP